MKPYYSDDFVTIFHGDCLSAREWVKADVLVTDPPYGMALRSGWCGSMGDMAVRGDADTQARDATLLLWGDRPALVFGRWSVQRPAAARARLIWEKGEHTGMGDLALPWKPNTEDIYVLGAGFAGRRDSSVLRYLAVAGCVGRANKGVRNHETEKPVSLMSALLAKCPPGVIADPFMGGGATLVAAKALGRKAIGVELEERHCETAARRCAQEVFDFGVAA